MTSQLFKLWPILRLRLMLMLLALSAVAMIAIAYPGYHSGEVNLTTRIFNQISSVRASKVYQIQAYFEIAGSNPDSLNSASRGLNQQWAAPVAPPRAPSGKTPR